MKYGIGQSVKRGEDLRFLTGNGTYLDDVNLQGQAYACMVYSQHAHALINSIDIEQAMAAAGVLTVLTGQDVESDGLGNIVPRFMPEDMGGPKGYRTARPILAQGRVRHVGERVAMVVAESIDAAKAAADLIDVDYELLPAAVEARSATDDGAPLIYAENGSNISFTIEVGDAAAAEAAFASAAHVSQATFQHPRLNGNAMEARGSIGSYDPIDGRYTLHANTQLPHILRGELCRMVFQVPESQMRVVAYDVGGGFGLKTNPFPEDALVLWAARRLGRPVKWIASRTEHIMTDDHGRDQFTDAEIALNDQGKILAFRCVGKTNVGAYLVGSGGNPVIHFLRLLKNVYEIPLFDVTGHAVMTNTSPTAPYRGAGRPEGVFAVERMLDKAADEMGIGRIDIRRRNIIAPEAMPAKTHMNFIYDSGEFEKVLDQTISLADVDGFDTRRMESESRGKIRGLGIASYIEDAGALNERMDLRVDTSGIVTILAGTSSQGQGHETVYRQIVSDWLSIPIETVRFVQNDTDRVPVGRGTYASRSMVVGTGALHFATEQIIDKGKKLAAFMMETDTDDIEYVDGAFSVAGTDKSVPFRQVAMMAYKPMGLPPELGIGLEAQGAFGVTMPSFPNGCHVCEVEIDPETGEISLDRYTLVDDIGVVINPMLATGQMHGGVAQGVGQVLMEKTIYDVETGQLLSGTFMDYAMPRADDLPEITVAFHEVPCLNNPAGVKGAGEGGTVGATSAVFSALTDALRRLGVTDLEMPATPERIWWAIQTAK